MIKELARSVPGGSPLLVCRWPPGEEHGGEAGEEASSPSLLVRAPISSRGPHPHARGASATDAVTLGIRASTSQLGWGGGRDTNIQPPATTTHPADRAGSLGPALAPPPCSRLHAGPIFEPPATILLRVTGIGTPRPQLPATQRPGGLLKALSGQMSRPKTHWSPPSLGKAQTPQATVRDHGSAHWSWRLS